MPGQRHRILGPCPLFWAWWWWGWTSSTEGGSWATWSGMRQWAPGTVLCVSSSKSPHYTSSSYVWVPKMLSSWLHRRALFPQATRSPSFWFYFIMKISFFSFDWGFLCIWMHAYPLNKCKSACHMSALLRKLHTHRGIPIHGADLASKCRISNNNNLFLWTCRLKPGYWVCCFSCSGCERT